MKKKKTSKKTKILAVGDIHGDSTLVKRLAEKAKKEKVDLVILAGDLTFAEMSTDNIIGPFAKVKKQVLLIPGNHETVATVDFLAQTYAPYAKNLHGYSIKRGDLGIFGAGGTDAGIFQLEDNEIFHLLKKGNDGVKNSKRKIMVTHMHPKGGKAEKFGFPGSKAIRKAIDEFHPDILISSHMHEASGIEEEIGDTKVINVSRKAKVFEI